MLKSPPLKNYEEYAAYLTGKQIMLEEVPIPAQYPCVAVIYEGPASQFAFVYLADFHVSNAGETNEPRILV